MESVHLKYLAVNPVDLKWGTAVNSAGFQEIPPGADYPPRNHPSRYIFKQERGRVLHEYQLLYITEGRGKFFCETLGRTRAVNIERGMMFLLFPGEWHSYHWKHGTTEWRSSRSHRKKASPFQSLPMFRSWLLMHLIRTASRKSTSR